MKKDEQQIGLLVLKEAIRRWQRTVTNEDWMTWVAKKTGFDQKYITKALTKGEIVPPKENLIDEIVEERSTDEESARQLRSSLESASPARQRLISQQWKRHKSEMRTTQPRKGK